MNHNQRTSLAAGQSDDYKALFDDTAAREECPHEWGHGSLIGYATVLRRSASQESSRRTKRWIP